MASLQWIKLNSGFYKDAKIKKILTNAGGERVVFFWIQLLALAAELNKSGFLKDDKDIYTYKMLADQFNLRPSFVRKSLEILTEEGLLEQTESGVYFIPTWSKHQSEDKLEKIREKDRIRKREAYRKSKEISAEFSAENPQNLRTQNKKENQNQNENILLCNQTNQIFEEPATQPTLPPLVGEEAHILPQTEPNVPTLPLSLTKPIGDYCSALSPKEEPSQTRTLLLTWLTMLQEKNRLPTACSLPLLLEKLHPCAKESGLSLPGYLKEAICRGWHSFYPVPRYAPPKNGQPRSKSYNIEELEAMI